jgi:hypothetical protein
MRFAVAALLLCGCGSSTKSSSDLAVAGGDLAGSGVAFPASDTFDGTTLDSSWSVLHPEAVSITVAGSALTLRLTHPALWFNSSEGVLVYKLVSGNFKLTSTVHARKASAPTLPPDPPEQFGGVMAHAPSAPPENYVHVVVGHDPNALATETKNTTSSSSQYTFVPWATGDAQLRVCRVDGAFQMLERTVGAASWTLTTTFMRPDLPATLQAGLNIYTSSSAATPDLQVSFDEATFAPVSSAADCSTD